MELLHGDCLELMQTIPTDSVDLILCDLPYGTTACKWDSIIPFAPLWREYNRVLKPNGAAVLFAAQPFTTELINSNRKAFRYCWYWRKSNVTGGTFAKVQPMRCIEDICVFYKRKPMYNPQGLRLLDKPKINKPAKTGVYGTKKNPSIQRYTGYPTHLLSFAKDPHCVHPTQKPVALLEYLIRTYTQAGDTVLDNCMGSGSTGVACVNTGRYFIGIEQDATYFEIAARRIAEAADRRRHRLIAA